jgi:hypothetical protein
MYPSTSPSDGPSVSIDPASSPSARPSLSLIPSSTPSDDPSISVNPSLDPTSGPSLSHFPSFLPSIVPSKSLLPSMEASLSPTVSFSPSYMVSVELSLTTGGLSVGGSNGLFNFTFYSLNGDEYQFPIKPVPKSKQTKSYYLILPSEFKKETKVVAATIDGWYLTKVSVNGEEWYNGSGFWVDGQPYNKDSAYAKRDYHDAWLVNLEGSPQKVSP